ncbi:MAG: hypothetical protein ACK4M6_15915, partial [Hyphomonas sp.]
SGAFRLGLAAPAGSGPVAAGVVDLNDPGAGATLRTHSGKRSAARLGAQAAQALAEALAGVADAVDRCEGPRGDCGDPSRNPALGRAAALARRCGASDADILRAVDGERPALALRPFHETPPLIALADRTQLAAGAPEALLAAESSLDGGLISTFAPRDAEALAEGGGPLMFEMLAAHLKQPWLILRIATSIMEHPGERYLAASELSVFGERALADIEAQVE